MRKRALKFSKQACLVNLYSHDETLAEKTNQEKGKENKEKIFNNV